MRKLYFLIVLGFVMVVFASCEKAGLVPDFYIGNTQLADMTYFGHLDIYAAYGEEKTMEVDVNDDGIMDIKFHASATDSMGEGDKRGSVVWCINKEVEIGYLASAESLYKMASSASGTYVEYVYNERSHFFCEDCQNLGKHNETFFTSPAILLQADSIASNLQWSSSTQILSNFDKSRVSGSDEGDAPVYNYIISGFWATVDHGYMVFRIKTGVRKYRYGFMKLMVEDHRHLVVTEKGLQKIGL